VSPRTKEMIALNEDKLATLLVEGEALEVSRLFLYWEWISKLQLTHKTLELVVVITCWWRVGSLMLSHHMYKGNPKR
jgi:hypothetical protein